MAVDVITEPEVSGEIADRTGINQVWAGIDAKRWDLIVAEESSRLYRHHTKAGELFESAVDAGVRVICPPEPSAAPRRVSRPPSGALDAGRFSPSGLLCFSRQGRCLRSPPLRMAAKKPVRYGTMTNRE